MSGKKIRVLFAFLAFCLFQADYVYAHVSEASVDTFKAQTQVLVFPDAYNFFVDKNEKRTVKYGIAGGAILLKNLATQDGYTFWYLNIQRQYVSKDVSSTVVVGLGAATGVVGQGVFSPFLNFSSYGRVYGFSYLLGVETNIGSGFAKEYLSYSYLSVGYGGIPLLDTEVQVGLYGEVSSFSPWAIGDGKEDVGASFYGFYVQAGFDLPGAPKVKVTIGPEGNSVSARITVAVYPEFKKRE